MPGFFIRGNSGIPHWLEPRDFALEEHKRYIVNVGSVGQPRGQDVRATYCLFDEGAGEVFFRQVPFDLAAYRTALEDAGVPDETTHFLEVAARTEPRPLREMLDFSPPRADQVTDTDIGVAKLHRAVRSARRWRLGALLLFVLLVAGGGYLYSKRDPAYTEYAAVNAPIIPAPGVGRTCLPALADSAGPIGPDRSLADWTVRVMRPEAQTVNVELPENPSGRRGGSALPYLRLSSRTPEEMTLISRPVRADAGMRFQLLAACKAQTPIEGYLELILMQTCADGTERMVLHYALENIPRERWKAIRKSSDPDGLPEAGQVRWVFRGQFTGELLIRGCDLKRTR